MDPKDTPITSASGQELLGLGQDWREYLGSPHVQFQIVGDPLAALDYFDGQQKEPDSCGPNSVAHALEVVTGTNVDAGNIVAQAAELEFYSPGGMTMQGVGQLMEANGIPVTVHDGPNTPEQLVDALHSHPVILAVDAAPGSWQSPPDLSRGVLWDPTWTPDSAIGFRGIDEADHVVVVKGIQEIDGERTAIVADSGTGYGYTHVPFEQLIDAADGSGISMVVPEVNNFGELANGIQMPTEPMQTDHGTEHQLYFPEVESPQLQFQSDIGIPLLETVPELTEQPSTGIDFGNIGAALQDLLDGMGHGQSEPYAEIDTHSNWSWDSGRQDPYADNSASGTYDFGNHNSNSFDVGGSGSHDSGSHDSGSHDSGSHDSGSHDSGSHSGDI